jgi:hypothetical protein
MGPCLDHAEFALIGSHGSVVASLYENPSPVIVVAVQ